MVSAAAVAIAVVGVSLGAWLLLREQLGGVVNERLNRQVGFAIKMDSAGMRRPAPETGPDTPLLQTVFPDGSWLTPPGQAVIPVSATERGVARQEHPDTTEDVKINGASYRVLTRWIRTKQTGANGRAIQIAVDLSEMNGTLARFGLIMALTGFVGIAAAGILGYLLTRAGLRPVGRVAAAAEHVASTQDLGAAVPVAHNDPDEVARVAESINAMLAALGAARDAQRQLVEDASHELATPLTSLRTNVDLLLRAENHPERQLAPEDRQRLLHDIQAQMRELDHLIEEVVELARDPLSGEEVIELDLAEVVRVAVTRARARTPQVEFHLAETPVLVRGRAAALERAVLNLVDNAAKWGPPEVPVEVLVRERGASAEIMVADRGPGIADGDLERVFERFHRSREARSMPGSGLGLAIVRKVVREHGGRAWMAHRDGGGTEAWIQLPSVAPAPYPL
jgi:two-component system, OmpR family, sensor histidine kinase MprB